MNNTLYLFTLSLSLSLSLSAFSQVPDTEIFLVDLTPEGSEFKFENLRNLTNHKGYDNQPWFTPDGKSILYTSMTSDSTTDIFKIDLATQKKTQITKTPKTSEYSPRYFNHDKNISVVRVEEDGATQRLWQFELNGKKPKLIAPWLDSVGYYTFITRDLLVAFVLGKGDEHTLRLVNLKDKTEKIIDKNVGRCFNIQNHSENLKDTTFYTMHYVVKTSGPENAIKNYIFNTGKSFPWHNALPESEDFVFYDNVHVLMASGSGIHVLWLMAKFVHWEKMESFNFPGIKNITRLVISPDKKTLAIVAEVN